MGNSRKFCVQVGTLFATLSNDLAACTHERVEELKKESCEYSVIMLVYFLYVFDITAFRNVQLIGVRKSSVIYTFM